MYQSTRNFHSFLLYWDNQHPCALFVCAWVYVGVVMNISQKQIHNQFVYICGCKINRLLCSISSGNRSDVGSCYGCFLFIISTICLDDTITCIVIISNDTHYHHGRINIDNFSNQSIVGAVSAIIVLVLVQEASILAKSDTNTNTKHQEFQFGCYYQQ